VAPVREVVHVLQELIPRHHAWRRVRLDEVGATRALRVSTNLLAHVFTDARELVLHLSPVLEVLCGARLAVLGDLRVLRIEGHRLLERRGPLLPALDHVVAPVREVVHVLQELIPSHHAWRRVGLDEVGAVGALRVSAHLLTHVLAGAREHVLQLGAVLEVLRGARLAVLGDLRTLRIEGHRLLERRGPLLPPLNHVVAPVREVVHVLQKLIPSHHAWRRVRSHEVGATRALRVSAHLLTHVLADASELVL